MTLMDASAAEQQLLRVAEVGRLLTALLAEAVPDPLLVGNAPMELLCRLDLGGPMRPAEIAELVGLTTGGASKLIDRLEGDGIVARRHHAVEGDDRGVLVTLTPAGSEAIRSLARRFVELLPDAGAHFDALASMLEDVQT